MFHNIIFRIELEPKKSYPRSNSYKKWALKFHPNTIIEHRILFEHFYFLSAIKRVTQPVNKSNYYSITCVYCKTNLNRKWKSQNFLDYCTFTVQSGLSCWFCPWTKLIWRLSLAIRACNYTIQLKYPNISISWHLYVITDQLVWKDGFIINDFFMIWIK